MTKKPEDEKKASERPDAAKLQIEDLPAGDAAEVKGGGYTEDDCEFKSEPMYDGHG